MRPQIVALPMYSVPEPALGVFWSGLRHHMEVAGLENVPDRLTLPEDYAEHWLDPDVLLSQTCGYPLTSSLVGKVRYVATPCYRAVGCEGPLYSSAIVVRTDDPAVGLADLFGRRAAYNGDDSQSGMNALRGLVAPLAQQGRFFGEVLRTGAHRLSVDAVQSGRADVAAIDAVTWALLSRDNPEDVAGLRILAFSAPAPGLPFITALRSSDETVARLRMALVAACADPDLAEARSAMLLECVSVLPSAAYAVIPRLQSEAETVGYPRLD